MGIREVGVLIIAVAGAHALGGPVSGAAKEITLLHTNDIHGHVFGWTGWEGALKGQRVGGYDRLGTAIQSVRSEVGKDRTLLLDAGDTLGDTALADLSAGEVVISLMNHLGYDAMALGNHEFDFGVATLKAREKSAKFPFLAANVLSRTTGMTVFRPYIVRNVGGVRVGILGLGYPNTPLTTARRNVEGLRFAPVPDTVRQMLPLLRAEGAQLIIVLSHYGLGADRRLAETVPGIDVIIGGHSHNRVQQPMTAGSTLIVQAGAHGSDLGRLDLHFEGGKITSYRGTLIPLAHDKIAADNGTAELMKSLAATHQPARDDGEGKRSRR